MNAKQIISLLVIALAAASVQATTQGEAVFFDRVVIVPDELFFEEDTRIRPDRTYVNLRNFRPMSNTNGDRFAMVTVQNQLNSKLILDREEFVGIFADGSRLYPREIDIRLDASRTRTFILKFGNNQFPLVKIVIDNG